MANANIKAVITAEDKASATLKGFGDNVDSTSKRITSALKTAALAAGALATTGIGAAVKASWDQVDAVQQATVGLKAYEKDASKVNKVLSDLVGYARSDLGVLFNRKDLFQSAQALRLMGDSSDDLVQHVKILSRSVGLGLSNWDDLNQIVGRVGSTGRLTGEDFDNLTKAGFRLDKNLRNTNITWKDLFNQLDKGIPADALEGQANTIKGGMIRLQTAFRNVGDAILGVDRDTGKFIEGGLGSKFTRAIGSATGLLKDLSNNIGAVVKQVTDYLTPKFEALFNTIKEHEKAFKDLGWLIGTGLVLAIGFAIDAVNLMIEVLAPAVSWIKDNTWVIWAMVTAFAAWKTALAIDAAVKAFQAAMLLVRGEAILTSGTIAGTTRNVGLLSGALNLLKGPWQIALAIVGAAAVIATIKEVSDAIGHAKRKLEDFNNTPVKVGGSNGINVKGGSDIGLVQQLRNAFQFRASGGPVTSGSPYVVGEKGPELMVPNRSGTVIPNNRLGGMGSVTINVNAGAYMGSQQDARKYAQMIMNAWNDLQASRGMA